MSTFSSFLMGGFECADHINRSGQRVNLHIETAHDTRVAEDYANLVSGGITVVREGICWSAVETAPYSFDFSEVHNRIREAEANNIQQIWDLCHFGYPDGLFPTHPNFCSRFEALCTAFAKFYREVTNEVLFVVPVNEISFLSWHSGDVRGTVPFAVNSGWDIKYHLCKAAIVGINALKVVLPDCRIVLVEPLIKIHSSIESESALVDELNSHQFQAMDIIAGRMCPELGGKEENLDILGFNYYWNSQWEHAKGSLEWPDTEMKRSSLASMLQMAYHRYNRPLFLSETGHFGEGREQWIDEVTQECADALRLGVDLLGMCIYPVTDRPDWDDLTNYHDCGIWDLDEHKNRIPHLPSFKAIARCNEQIGAILRHSEDSRFLQEAAAMVAIITELDEVASEANV
jgi:beta-glucosidase/6-phospho-beta-glucosidase/beta-galactosidase